LDRLTATVAAQDGQAALLDLHEQLWRRERELHDLMAERAGQEAQIRALDAERARLQARLDRILGSRPLRLYSRLQVIPGLRQLARLLLGVRPILG
jgi:hypothetical protein